MIIFEEAGPNVWQGGCYIGESPTFRFYLQHNTMKETYTSEQKLLHIGIGQIMTY